MTNEVLQLEIINFCNLENDPRNALSITYKYFNSDKQATAHSRCGDYIRSLDAKHYLGWNDEVYPKFKVKRVNFENIE